VSGREDRQSYGAGLLGLYWKGDDWGPINLEKHGICTYIHMRDSTSTMSRWEVGTGPGARHREGRDRPNFASVPSSYESATHASFCRAPHTSNKTPSGVGRGRSRLAISGQQLQAK
jgi:hypothetical protein